MKIGRSYWGGRLFFENDTEGQLLDLLQKEGVHCTEVHISFGVDNHSADIVRPKPQRVIAVAVRWDRTSKSNPLF